MSDSARVELIRRMLERGEKGEPSSLSHDFVSHAAWDVAVNRRIKKPAEAKKLPAVFSHQKVRVEEAIEEDDKVVVRWRLNGTWSGPLPFAPNVKPTNRPVEITGINTYRFEGDRVVESFGEVDAAAFHDMACERLNPAEAVVNPADCAKMLTTLSPIQRVAGKHG